MANAIVLDLETAPIDDVQTYLEPVSAPANYKDPDKSAAYIAEKTQALADRAGLDPDLNQIVCIGVMREDMDREPQTIICRNEHEERVGLTQLWSYLHHGGDIITFNGFRFDLPVIMRRSFYLGIPWRVLSIDKYRSNHIDLFQKLTFNGAIGGHSLGFYAQRCGLPGDLDVKGEDIAALVRSGDWAAIAAHCRQDVLWTAALAKKHGYWDGMASLPEAVGF